MKTAFLTYSDIKYIAEDYAKKNNCKVKIEIVNHKTHNIITLEELSLLLYNAGLPAYRNKYNLRSSNKERMVFFLAVKGMSIVVICNFIYAPNVEINGYKVESNGQLSFVLQGCAPYRGLDENNFESPINLSTIYKEESKMIEIRETEDGQMVYVDGYYVGTIYSDGTIK